MKLLLSIVAFSFLCTCAEACVTVDTKNDVYTVDDSGCVQ